MSDHEVKMIILSTDDLDSSIKFYEDLGMGLKFRDGAHFAALDGGPVTLALATSMSTPPPRPSKRPAAESSRARMTTPMSAARWSTTTRATGWCSTARCSASVWPASESGP